jgi:hypothetical protein
MARTSLFARFGKVGKLHFDCGKLVMCRICVFITTLEPSVIKFSLKLCGPLHQVCFCCTLRTKARPHTLQPLAKLVNAGLNFQTPIKEK